MDNNNHELKKHVLSTLRAAAINDLSAKAIDHAFTFSLLPEETYRAMVRELLNDGLTIETLHTWNISTEPDAKTVRLHHTKESQQESFKKREKEIESLRKHSTGEKAIMPLPPKELDKEFPHDR